MTPRRLLVSFGGFRAPWSTNPKVMRDFTAEVSRLFKSAKPFGFETRNYDEVWLRKQPFYEDHRDVFDLPRMGLLFKPYVISQAMDWLRDGEYLVWADSNMLAKADPQPLFDVCDRVGAFIHGHKGVLPNAHWTRKDAFVLIGCDKPEYWQTPQCKASLIAFKVSEWARLFISEWLSYCCDPHIIDDARPNECGPNLPGFKHGRAEQAVLSLLRQRHGIPLQPQSMIFQKVIPV